MVGPAAFSDEPDDDPVRSPLITNIEKLQSSILVNEVIAFGVDRIAELASRETKTTSYPNNKCLLATDSQMLGEKCQNCRIEGFVEGDAIEARHL